MSFLQEAIKGLGIEKEYSASVKYTDHFKEYGANMRIQGENVLLKLSRSWKNVSDEIKIGVAQELLVGMLKIRKTTTNMDIYNNFIRNLHIAIPKKEPEPALLDSFNRVNEKYFFGMMNIPNIVWGDLTLNKLGSYDYRVDTISLSKVLEKDERFLDLVMHHELLHKKHKFTSKNGRALHHSTAFRKEEKEFENYDELEKELKRYLVKANLRKFFKFW